MGPLSYGKQWITEDDIEEVTKVLKSDFLTQGPAVSRFENAFKHQVDAKYALACANGTAALHLAMLALNIGEGDIVISSPLSFVADANCVEYVGGKIGLHIGMAIDSQMRHKP